MFIIIIKYVVKLIKVNTMNIYNHLKNSINDVFSNNQPVKLNENYLTSQEKASYNCYRKFFLLSKDPQNLDQAKSEEFVKLVNEISATYNNTDKLCELTKPSESTKTILNATTLDEYHKIIYIATSVFDHWEEKKTNTDERKEKYIDNIQSAYLISKAKQQGIDLKPSTVNFMKKFDHQPLDFYNFNFSPIISSTKMDEKFQKSLLDHFPSQTERLSFRDFDYIYEILQDPTNMEHNKQLVNTLWPRVTYNNLVDDFPHIFTHIFPNKNPSEKDYENYKKLIILLVAYYLVNDSFNTYEPKKLTNDIFNTLLELTPQHYQRLMLIPTLTNDTLQEILKNQRDTTIYTDEEDDEDGNQDIDVFDDLINRINATLESEGEEYTSSTKSARQ